MAYDLLHLVTMQAIYKSPLTMTFPIEDQKLIDRKSNDIWWGLRVVSFLPRCFRFLLALLVIPLLCQNLWCNGNQYLNKQPYSQMRPQGQEKATSSVFLDIS